MVAAVESRRTREGALTADALLAPWFSALKHRVGDIRLFDRHAAFVASDPPRRGPRPPGVHMIFVAAAVARLGGLP